MKQLFFVWLLVSSSVIAQEREFPDATILFKETTEYTFEMQVIEIQKKSMKLGSDKVFKQTLIEFYPQMTTRDDSPYIGFKYYNDFGQVEDDTVSLEIDLSDFYTSNGSYWAKKSQLRFEESFEPGAMATSAVTTQLDNHKITDQSIRDDNLQLHTFLAANYALNKPYSESYVESKIFDKHFKVNNIVDRSKLSFKTKIMFNNAAFFARDMKREKLDINYMDAFYFSESYSFASEFFKSVRKSKDVLYSYLIYNLSGVHPISIRREIPSSNRSGSRPEFELVKGSNGEDYLNCTKTDKRRFECKFKIAFYSEINMPNSTQLKENPYPAFVIRALKKEGYTNELMNKEMSELDFSKIIKQQ